MCSPRFFFCIWEATFFCNSFRTLLMATGWTRSLLIERSWSFVTISNFKFDISFFWQKSLLQVHQFSLFFFVPLHNYTYWPSPLSIGDFFTVVASYVYISLWIHLWRDLLCGIYDTYVLQFVHWDSLCYMYCQKIIKLFCQPYQYF